MSPSHSGSAPRKRRAAGILTLILAMALAALFILVAPVLAQNQDPPTDPPATPTGLSGEAGHDRVTLRWNDPGDDTITGYQVLRLNKAVDDVGVFHIHVDDTGSAANGYVDQLDVEPETNYVYRLKARNAAGLSSQSDFFDARTPAGPPRKPTGLKGYEDHEWVALRWDDPGDDTITGYQVLRRNPAVDAQGVFHIIENDTGSAATEYVDRMDVEPETDYVYRIKARNAAGLSSQSDYFDARTPAGPPPGSPATPNGLTGEVHPYHVTLSWDDPEDRTSPATRCSDAINQWTPKGCSTLSRMTRGARPPSTWTWMWSLRPPTCTASRRATQWG